MSENDARCFPPLDIVSKNLLLAAEALHAFTQQDDRVLLLQLETEDSAGRLHACIGDIICFAKAVASGLYIGIENGHYMKCLVSIFDLAFLDSLVSLRQQLLSPAAQSDDLVGQALVCWVDFFFACFSEMISTISSSQSKIRKALPFSLHRQRQEENLRVACQLPQTWSNFPTILRSQHASPAAKRLSLSVLFAAFVVRPDIEDCDPWAERNTDPRHIMECVQVLLDEFITQERSMTLSESDATVGCDLRTAYAMAIALYASAEIAIQRLQGDEICHPESPFRPHTLAVLLELMHIVLCPCNTDGALILKELDVSQSILLQWGHTVPWAWMKWNEPRTLQFDTVVKVTANWLRHLDSSICIMSLEDRHVAEEKQLFAISDSLSRSFKGAASFDPDASLIAFFHQIYHINNSLNSEITPSSPLTCETRTLHFYRTTWILTELVLARGKTLSSGNLSLVTEQLIVLFVALDAPESGFGTKIKEEIIRCLSALHPNLVGNVFQSFQKNVKFVTKISEAIGRTLCMISGGNSEQLLLASGNSCSLVTLLDLISLMCKSDAVSCLPVTTASLLSGLIEFLSSRSGWLELRVSLLNCLASAHTQGRLGKSPSGADKDTNCRAKLNKTWDDEDAYNLALETSGIKLSLASFASYLALTVKKSTDVLLVAEAWDYLRDVLIILVTGRVDVDEPVSGLPRALAAEKICQGLEGLLRRSDVKIARFLLQSPMTLSLIEVVQKPSEELRRVCKDFVNTLRKMDADLNKDC